jgi:hypothetical protein
LGNPVERIEGGGSDDMLAVFASCAVLRDCV